MSQFPNVFQCEPMRDLFAKPKPSWARRHGLGVSARKMLMNWRNRAKSGFSYRSSQYIGERGYNHYTSTDYHQRYALPAIFAERSWRALHGVHMPLFRPLFEASDPYKNYKLSHSLSHVPTGHNTEQNSMRLRQRNLNYMAEQRTTLSPYLFAVLVLQKIARLPDDIIKFIIRYSHPISPRPTPLNRLLIRYDMKTLTLDYDE